MDRKVKDLISGQKLITLSPDETVESAFQKFQTSRITSAPVLENSQKILGLVDVLDLMALLVQIATKPLTDIVVGESRKLTTDDMQMVHKRSKEFKLAAIGNAIDFSKRNPFVSLYEDQTVKEAIDTFSSKGIHRIAVLKREGDQICGILSQTTVLTALASDPNLKQFQTKMGQLKHKTENLICVRVEELAIDSFIKMHESKLSSLGVTNYEGHLVGNLSAADLLPSLVDFRTLLRSTIDYLKMLRKEEGRPEDFVVSCSSETSLHDAVLMMAKERIHRIYQVDSQKKPLSVISFTDLLKEISL
jgi:CBS domain-containing protein